MSTGRGHDVLPTPPQVPPDGDGRAELLRSVLAQAPEPGRRRSRRLRRVLVGVGAVGLAGSAATAYAVVHRPVERSTAVECFLREPDLTAVVVSSVTGDPVEDCAAEWRRVVGDEPPPLTAYDNDLGAVAVYAQGMPVPPGLRPLGTDFTQQAAGVELTTSVDDEVDGLGSRCWATGEATAFAHSEVARTGATGAQVVVRAVADGVSSCATAFWVGPDEQLVLDVRRPPDAGSLNDADRAGLARLEAFEADLRRSVSLTCLALPAAVDAVRAAGARAGMTAPGLEVRAVPDPVARCTRADLVPAGLMQVVLRGPAG